MTKRFLISTTLLWIGAVFAFGQAQRYHFEHPQMGTLFKITLYSSDSVKAFQAAKEAFHRIDTLNYYFSDYDPESELNALSSQSGVDTCVQVSEELWDVIGKSIEMYAYSGGAFDITIGPKVQLWRRARRKNSLPDRRDIRKASKSIGSQYIKREVTGRCIRLKKPNMRLDLGGIAKGYAVDEAFSILKGHGISQALVDGGGDLMLGDPPPGKEGWEIQMEYLQEGGIPGDTVLVLDNLAVATSGDTYRYIEIDGERYSHIMDPKSGFGLTNRRKVTVLAPACVWADAWASATSILGPRKSRAKLRTFPEISALFIEAKEEGFSQVVLPQFFTLNPNKK